MWTKVRRFRLHNGCDFSAIAAFSVRVSGDGRGMSVGNVPSDPPAPGHPISHAHWLAELAEVLDKVHNVLNRLDLSGDQRAAAHDLHHRIEAARHEVRSLRHSRSLAPRDKVAPEWSESGAW